MSELVSCGLVAFTKESASLRYRVDEHGVFALIKELKRALSGGQGASKRI